MSDDKLYENVKFGKHVLVEDDVKIGAETAIWHFSHLMHGCEIGKNCTIGKWCEIGPGVKIGDGCKIQNNVSIYSGVSLGENVFIGPSVVFTNVKNPRACIHKMDKSLNTKIHDNVSIGANATIVCGNELKEFSFVGAGSVVINTVMAHNMVLGNPAKFMGIVCKCGERIPLNCYEVKQIESVCVCNFCGYKLKL